ncbi:UNVERIFIED_CONTAM: hypothetical protein HDU68_010396 [Siphonaria sp. JEL0065]|nr:hypothetical protein HDU68_010396 [Siphonaria sp. JEL0065]
MFTRTQSNMTLYSWNCDPTGTPTSSYSPPSLEPGNGTVSNPGHNSTLQNALGGTSGANLVYSNKTFEGHSNVYLRDGVLHKSFMKIAYNPVTNEQVVFGNDWTMNYLSSELQKILMAIPVPMFAAIIEVKSGYVVATSSNQSLVSSDGSTVLSLYDIQDPFIQDFSEYINSLYKPEHNPPSQMGQMEVKLSRGNNIFVDRVIAGSTWKLEMNTLMFGGANYLFLTYLSLDAIEEEVLQMSRTTGFIMLGILIAFLCSGYLFSWVISRQLQLVAKQILLLKQLKFKEVLDKNSGIKQRSFLFELAGLQESFHEMVLVFAQTIKASQSMRALPTVGQSSQGEAPLTRKTSSTWRSQQG